MILKKSKVTKKMKTILNSLKNDYYNQIKKVFSFMYNALECSDF